MQSPQQADMSPQVIRAIVVKEHSASDISQLALAVDDIVCVLEQDETGWWGGHKEDEDVTGWFPGSCVRRLPEEGESLMTSNVLADEEPREAHVDNSDHMPMWTADEAAPDVPPNKTAADEKKLEMENSSPQRRISLVASPQRHPRDSASSVTPNGTPPVSAQNDHIEALKAENDRLNMERRELSARCDSMRRQSDVDRHKFAAEMEEAVKLERQKLHMVESQCFNENAEKVAILAETEALKEQLEMERDRVEKERRNSQVLQDEHAKMVQRFQSELQEKESELRSVQKSGQKLLLSEKKVKQELDEYRQELDVVRTQTASQDTQLPRRLFPSGAYEAARASPPGHSGSGNGDVARQLFDHCDHLNGSPPADLSRGRQPAPNSSPSAEPPPTTKSGQYVPQLYAGRPPSRATSSEGRHVSPAVFSNRMGHAVSTGNLAACRSASSHTPLPDEAPRAGSVREGIKTMEKRVKSQTPVRQTSAGTSGRGNRTEPRALPKTSLDRTGHTPPALPKTVPPSGYAANRMPPAHGFGLSLEADAHAGAELDLGMSPLRRNAPQSAPVAALIPADFNDFRRAASGAPARSCSRTEEETVAPEISVRQRINHFKQMAR